MLTAFGMINCIYFKWVGGIELKRHKRNSLFKINGIHSPIRKDASDNGSGRRTLHIWQ